MARVLIHSNAVWAASGYGTMTRNLVKRFKNRLKQDVAVSAFYGLQGSILTVDGIETYPMGLESWGNDIVEAHVQKFQANCLLTIIDLFVLREYGKRMPGKWYPYFPLDGDPVSPNFISQLQGAVEGLVYAKFAKNEFSKIGNVPCPIRYIPVGVDTNIFKPLAPSIVESKKMAKRAMGYPEDIILVGMVGANQSVPDRKCFTEQVEAFMRFHEKYPKSRMYIHTDPSPRRQGIDLNRIIELLGASKLVDFPNEYQYHIGYEDAKMQSIFNAFDMFTHTSGGEGFGCTIIEAQANGTPIIVANNTAMPELLGSGKLVQNHHKDYYALGVWHYRPEVSDIFNAMCELAEGNKEEQGRKAREFIMDKRYDWDCICDDFWKPFFEEVDDRWQKQVDTSPSYSIPFFKEESPTITVAALIDNMSNDTNKFLRKVTSFDYNQDALDYVFMVAPNAMDKFKKWQKAHCPKAKVLEDVDTSKATIRLEKIVTLRNSLLSEVVSHNKDYVLFVDSDIVNWNDNILKQLISDHADIVAPLVLLDNTKSWFYDCWSFRAGGKNFETIPPYNAALGHPFALSQVESVGAFFLVRGVVAANGKFFVDPVLSDTGSFCKSITDKGGKIGIDQQAIVYHSSVEKNSGEAYWRGPVVPEELRNEAKDLLEDDTTGLGVALLDIAYKNYTSNDHVKAKGIRWAYNQADFYSLYMNSNPIIVDKMHKTLEIPHFIEVETSTKCNMGCKICENTYWKEPARVMTYDEYKHILDEFPKLKWIGLSGIGEHWLVPDFLKMVELTKSRNIYIEQFDNILHLNKERATAYIDMQVERVIASIDAATSKTYETIRPGSSWTKVISNINQLVELKKEKNSYWPELAFHYILNKDNVDEAPLFLDLLFQMGVKPLFVQYTRLLHSFPEIADKYIEVPDGLKQALDQRSQAYGIPIQWNADVSVNKPTSQTCTAWGMPFIFATGHVIPCCAQNEANRREFQKETALGNIFEQPFKDIWYGEKFNALRNGLREGKRPRCCIGCPIKKFPRGV